MYKEKERIEQGTWQGTSEHDRNRKMNYVSTTITSYNYNFKNFKTNVQ